MRSSFPRLELGSSQSRMSLEARPLTIAFSASVGDIQPGLVSQHFTHLSQEQDFLAIVLQSPDYNLDLLTNNEVGLDGTHVQPLPATFETNEPARVFLFQNGLPSNHTPTHDAL